jgi:8-oxo-dGTP pyrophosphatase MutT (NUDIX family)
MYISAETIGELEKKYGRPNELSFAYEMTQSEFEVVLASQKHGRSHDVTLFIFDQNDHVARGKHYEDVRLAVNRKPMYPPGAYRAPSGGVAPGEPFEQGALREAYEETGLVVSLEKYIIRARVCFSSGVRSIDWTSHVFTSSSAGGKLGPIDTHEIVEARWVTVAEMMGGIRDALLASGSTGLRYRSELADAVVRRWTEERLLPTSSTSNEPLV